MPNYRTVTKVLGVTPRVNSFSVPALCEVCVRRAGWLPGHRADPAWQVGVLHLDPPDEHSWVIIHSDKRIGKLSSLERGYHPGFGRVSTPMMIATGRRRINGSLRPPNQRDSAKVVKFLCQKRHKLSPDGAAIEKAISDRRGERYPLVIPEKPVGGDGA